jgi:transposase
VRFEERAKQSAGCERLMSIPDIGPLISNAIVVAIGIGDVSCKSRDFAACSG